MKLLLLLTSLLALSPYRSGCGRPKEAKPALAAGCYKGRLEVKGGCMNYTISVLSGRMDTALLVPSWTDEATGRTYTNVFALGSRCNFPNSLNAGDEFYFVIDTAVQHCMTCMIYYPVPPKHLSIRVLDQPCTTR